MQTKGTNWETLSFNETKHTIKQLAKENKLEWTDELDVEFSSEIEFLLGYKGRWLLCHMGKEFPYYIRYRLIGRRQYEKVKPEKFITVALEDLAH